MGKRDDHAAALAKHPAELVLGLGEPPRRDRRPLRLEGVRLRTREGIELGSPGERDGPERLLVPDAADVVRLPDEVRRAVEGGDEIARRLGELALVAKARLDEIHAPLRGGIHDRLGDWMERALRERGERPHLLYLVTEELDAKRLTARAREDVDETAAHGDLSSLVHALDALVAGERKRLHELVEAELRSRRQPDRAGPRLDRRQALCERACGREHDTAVVEDVERPRSLADEVRRRLQARLPADAAAREEPDPARIDVPADGLRRVARVLVLGQKHDE